MYGLDAAGQKQLNTNIVCTVFSIVAVVVRVYCKTRSKQGVKSDDWWIIVALAWYLASVSIVSWGSITGLGGVDMNDLLAVGMADANVHKRLSRYIGAMNLGFLLMIFSMFCCKISVLLFYRHIFFIEERYRKASMALMVVATAWLIATEISNLFTCQPVPSFWIGNMPGKCLNLNAVFLSTGIIDTLIDLAILLLPIRIVFMLQLPTKTKVAVTGIFALGGFILVTNVIRLRHTYQSDAGYISFRGAERWANIHMVTTFICACMPIYKHLWSSLSTTIGHAINQCLTSVRSVRGCGAEKTQNKSYVSMSQ